MRFNINVVPQLSSEAKLKVLKHVLNPGFRMTGRELARICGISHTMANNILRDFEQLHLVSGFRAGRSVVWTPKINSYTYIAAKNFYNNKGYYMPFEHLKQTIKEALRGRKVKKAVLFGSVASGEEKYSSDIDLFVLAGNRAQKDKIDEILEKLSLKCIELYGNTLNQYVLTEKEMESKKNLGVIKNIEGVVRII